MNEKRFSEFTEKILLNAGWFENRNCKENLKEWKDELKKSDPDFEIFLKVEVALLEFGEIHIKQRESGIDFARETLEINPLLCVGESDRFADFESEIGEKLYPLGEGGGNHFFIAIAESGKIYGLMMEILLIANTFDEALENLILGKKPQK